MSAPDTETASGARPALLIVQIGPPDPADVTTAITRTIQPCRALGELPDVAVVSGSVLSPELYRPIGDDPTIDLLAAADLLIIRDVADPDLLPVVAARRRQSRLTVFEPGQRLFPPVAGADLALRSVAAQLAQMADGVQLAGAGLDAQLEPLNPRRIRLPSHLWELPPARARAAGGAVVIGWIGGPGEEADLAIAIPALAGVLDRHPEVRVAILGEARLAPMLAGLPAERMTVTQAASFADVQRFADQLDIGIVPLAPDAGGRLVSDVRVLEYAARGVLVVCAGADPFHDLVRPGETGFLFRDAAELEAMLERALAEPDLRAAVTTAASRAAADRLERPHATDRLAFALSLAAQRGIRWPPSAARSPGRSPDGWLEAAGPGLRFAGSRYAALGSGQVEQLLSGGWALRAAGDVAEAARAFASAERLAPASHLPPLLLGMTVADPAEAVMALSRAEQRRPTSCRAVYERGLRELDRGDEGAAAAAFERARALAPAFGAAQHRLGELAETAGRLDEAARHYEDAALQNPCFALPVCRLALLAQGRGESGRAVALLERALAIDPEPGFIQFLLGRAYLETGRLNQARAHLERAQRADPAGWSAHLPAHLAGPRDAAAAMQALALAENRG